MIIRCMRNSGADLGLPPRGFFYSERTTFDVTVSTTYSVVGLGIFETVLLALVLDNTGKPNWLPAALFDLVRINVPSSWKFSLRDGPASSGGDAANRWIALWGYDVLVDDVTHSERLINRDPDALAIFYQHVDAESVDEDVNPPQRT